MAQVPDERIALKSERLLGPLSQVSSGTGASASVRTVLVAFGANQMVATAKAVATLVTGSASMLAEATHSWADTGNEMFLLVADRRSRRPPDRADLAGAHTESEVAVRLRALEAKLGVSPVVALLSLSAPDEPSLAV